MLNRKYKKKEKKEMHNLTGLQGDTVTHCHDI